jgi:hypothetical protein
MQQSRIESTPRRLPRFPEIGLGLALCIGVSLAAEPARGAERGDIGTLFQVDDSDPLRNIPSIEERNRHPLEFGYYLQDLIIRAEGAFEKQDWQKAVKYYEVLARLVPDRAVAFSRLCSAYAELGKVEIAAAYCGKAVQLGGAIVYDHLNFIRLTLEKKQFSQADIADVEASLAYLREHQKATLAPPPSASGSPAAGGSAAVSPGTPAVLAPPSASATAPQERTREEVKAEFMRRVAANTARALTGKKEEHPRAEGINLPLEIEVLSCKLALRLRDGKRLDACASALKALPADERVSLPFEWSHALIDRDEARASAALGRAKELHFPDAALKTMAAEQARTFLTHGWRGYWGRFRGALLIGLSSLVAIAVAVLWTVSSARRRKLEPAGQARQA